MKIRVASWTSGAVKSPVFSALQMASWQLSGRNRILLCCSWPQSQDAESVLERMTDTAPCGFLSNRQDRASMPPKDCPRRWYRVRCRPEMRFSSSRTQVSMTQRSGLPST